MSFTCELLNDVYCVYTVRSECEDVDECADDVTPQPCSEHAQCHNTLGSFVCDCDAGFTGTGVICDSTSFTFGKTMCLTATILRVCSYDNNGYHL